MVASTSQVANTILTLYKMQISGNRRVAKAIEELSMGLKGLKEKTNAHTTSMGKSEAVAKKVNTTRKRSTDILDKQGKKIGYVINKVTGNINASGKFNKVQRETVVVTNKTNKVFDKNINKMREVNVQTKNMYVNGKKVHTTISRTSKLAKEQGGVFSRMSSKIFDLNKKFANLRWAMVNLAFGAAAIAGAVYPLIKLGKAFMEFEQGAYKIAAVTGTSAKTIESNIVTAAQGSIFALKDLSAAYLDISKAGFNASDSMTILMNAQQLAVAGFSDLNSAADLLIKTIHGYNLSGAQAGVVTDIIAKAANSSKADVESFSTALAYTVSSAYAANVGLDQLAGALGILQNAGLSASKSGTALNATFQKLIAPTEKTKNILNYLGVAYLDSNGEARNAIDILDDLSSSLSDTSNKAEVLGNIFGNRAGRGALALSIAAEKTGKSIRTLSLEFNMAKSASENAAVQFESDANRTKRAWESVKRGVTTGNLGKLLSSIGTNAAEGVDTWIRTINKAMSKNKELRESLKKNIKDNNFYGVGKDSLNLFTRIIPFVKTVVHAKDMYDSMKDAKAEEQRAKAIQEVTGSEKTLLLLQDASAKHDTERVKSLTTQLKIDRLSEQTVLKRYEISKKTDRLNALKKEGKITEEQQKQLDILNDQFKKQQLQFDNATDIVNLQEKLNKLKQVENPSELQKAQIAIDQANLDVLMGNAKPPGTELDIKKAAEGTKDMFSYAKKASDAWADLVKNIEKSGHLSQTNKAIGYLEQVTANIELMAEAGKTAEEQSPYHKLEIDLRGYISEMVGMENTMDDLVHQRDKLKKSIDSTTTALENEQTELQNWENIVSDIDKNISHLTNARYKDQTATEKLMSAGERWLLQEKLSEKGITDAHAYIQEMLAKSTSGYYKLFDSISAVNDAVTDGKLSYDAWKETVSTFIEDTVKSGNKLGENVSSSVTQYQTLLMSTTKYKEDTGSNDKINRVEETVRNLRDAYNVYYGEMNDDVKYSVQAHEEEATGVFNTSKEVVTALQKQWAARANATAMVKQHESEVKRLTTQLNDQKAAYNAIKTQINELNASFDKLISTIQQAILKIKEFQEEGGGKDISRKTAKAASSHDFSQVWSGQNITEEAAARKKYQQDLLDTIYNNKHGVSQSLSTGVSYGVGKAPINWSDYSFGSRGPSSSPKQTATPVSASGGGTVNIGDIIINGVTGAAEDFAQSFVSELNVQMRL